MSTLCNTATGLRVFSPLYARRKEKVAKTKNVGALAAAVGMLAAVGLLVAMMLVVIEARPAGATFPGPNGKIAYTGTGLNPGIYTINPGGGGKTKVAVGETPSYSPDGKRIAYSAFDGNDYEIYTINAGGGGKTRVTDNNVSDYGPSYSPDGKQIAYTGSDIPSTGSEIYTINVGGGGKSKVTEGGDPSYSPDGERIAYAGFDGNDYEIYTINVGGGGDPFQVTDNDREDVYPDYSPDGRRIAHSSYDGYDSEIYTINVGGGTPFQVTNNIKDDEEPSYSPNGRKIAYEGFKGLGDGDGEDFDHEIYTINVGGGGKSQVTNTTNSFAGSPSWGRRP
jgi:Tol biopolymer transport system component